MRSFVWLIGALAAFASSAEGGELLPASALAGSVKIFASARGFDVFWTAQPEPGSSQFEVMHRTFSAAGAPLGKATTVIDQPGRHIAAGKPGTFGLTYQVSTSSGWQGHVLVVARDKTVFDLALPDDGAGHGTLAIGWDPVHAQWVIAGEQLTQLSDRPTGNVYNRLFTARLDATGGWIEKPTYITEPGTNASLSDWGNPMTWASDHMAIAWTASTGHDSTLYVTDLEPGHATHHQVASGHHGYMRCVLAWTRGGYVIAGAEDGDRPLESHLFIATLRDGVATPLRYLSDEARHGGEAVIASDGARVAVAWNEDEIGSENVRTSVHAAIVDARGTIANAFASKTPTGQHDWTQAMAWDGSQFALVHTSGINPSAIQLVKLPAAAARPQLAR
jgi:hypothetical protein